MSSEAFGLRADQLEAVIDQLPIGAIVIDDDGVIRRFNRHEEQLSGLKRSQTLGKSFFSEVAPCTKDVEMEARFREGIERGELDLDFEFSFPYPYNRVPRDVRIRAVSIQNQPTGVHVVLIEDITTRRQLEKNNKEMMSGLRTMIAAKHGREVGRTEPFEVEAYVLYAGIAGFRELAAEIEPGDLFRFLDKRLGRAVEIISSRGGHVDKVLGDGVLAYFVPEKGREERAPFDAVRAAVEIAGSECDEALSVDFRVGVSHGPIVVGPIGHPGFGESASIGRPISCARALSQVARPNEVLVDQFVDSSLSAAAATTLLRGTVLPGVSDHGDIYRIEQLELPG